MPPPAEDHVLELRTHDTVPDGGLREQWERLAEQDPHATVFHGPRYLARYAEVLGAPGEVRIHTLHREGQLVGVVPEAHERVGTPTGPGEVRRFLGGSEVTDYLGPIGRPEDRAEIAATYLADLAADRDWDEALLGGLAADSGWSAVLTTAAEQAGLTVLEQQVEDVCPVVDLAGGYDAYLGRLPGKLRQELTRKTRKLARDAGALELVEVPADEVAGELDAFLDLAAESAPDKAGFFRRSEMHDWFRTLAEEFAPDHVLRLHRLEVGGLLAAATVSLVWRGRWGLYNSAFDPVLAALSPGIVLVGLLLEQAAGEGCDVLDLLRGDEPYKYRFGAQDRPVERFTLQRGGA